MKNYESIVYINRQQEEPGTGAKESKGDYLKKAKDAGPPKDPDFEHYSESILFKLLVTRSKVVKQAEKPKKEVEVKHAIAEPVKEEVKEPDLKQAPQIEKKVEAAAPVKSEAKKASA